jgi:molybdopterin-guanine dinucleotide biosynthesis protein A
MGADKSFLQLAGKPLVAHAVAKLSRICADVHVLSANPAHAAFAPLVPDLHPNCGPVGGIEAALAHTAGDWSLILPVDVPFLPTTILQTLVADTVSSGETARVATFTVAGRPQPAVCLLHRQIAPSIAAAVRLGELKLLPVLEAAAQVLAMQHNQSLDEVLRINPISADILWFTNLNTPQDFAAAEANIAALDT